MVCASHSAASAPRVGRATAVIHHGALLIARAAGFALPAGALAILASLATLVRSGVAKTIALAAEHASMGNVIAKVAGAARAARCGSKWDRSFA
mmetsp:Transcript_13534/g.22287  ORF Transcript_13534/g.22287 Transcript_13534/m.22287 type:complete len:94 (-) Transcript_13534:1201-1482(-)